MRAVRSHLTYANVVSTLCLFLAVAGGAAYAADTVGSADIIDNEVFSVDVRDDTLAGGGLAAEDLQTNSVRTAELSNNQVRSIDIRDDTLDEGGLVAADLGPDSVGTSEVDGSLTGDDVANGTLLTDDITDGSLLDDDIADGTLLSADIGDGTLLSADVADGTLLGADVEDGALTGTDIANGSVVSTDVGDGALTGTDIQDNSVLAADVNEATLGIVPIANTLDGFDSARFKNPSDDGEGQCLNLGGATTCAQATVSGLTTGDDIYLTAWWRWYGVATGSDQAFCEIKRGTNVYHGALFGQRGNEHDTNNLSAMGSLIAIDTVAPSGSATYSLVCDETNGNVHVVSGKLVAVRLSG